MQLILYNCSNECRKSGISKPYTRFWLASTVRSLYCMNVCNILSMMEYKSVLDHNDACSTLPAFSNLPAINLCSVSKYLWP